MRDEISISCSPAGEPCVQLGRDDYDATRARAECKALIGLLRRLLGEEPFGARLRIKSNPHDFGAYYDVVCVFDSDNEEATDYAYRCENGLPERWDEEALKELAAP